MILRIDYDKMPEVQTLHNLNTGAVAILDSNNKMLAYKRSDEYTTDDVSWDWIRQDVRKN